MLFMILLTSNFLIMASRSIGFRELNFREKTKKAPLSAEQVNKYRDLAASEFPGRTARVIVVSANTGQHRLEAHGCKMAEAVVAGITSQ
ncbi:hypothetical protein BTW10_14215 [Chromohalobacter japonicus]|uniref:Uncharacterized protein n=1 Tax=Chromohalobacter japonicus TaxID=223900 RepID=A0A1Q8TA02_9GAMM|nr:hypothetical protein [Chromohalobacter japonicus]OLO10506.1 hypothetical protein BTW10_14215 [Chromohalobacter japonicus]